MAEFWSTKAHGGWVGMKIYVPTPAPGATSVTVTVEYYVASDENTTWDTQNGDMGISLTGQISEGPYHGPHVSHLSWTYQETHIYTRTKSFTLGASSYNASFGFIVNSWLNQSYFSVVGNVTIPALPVVAPPKPSGTHTDTYNTSAKIGYSGGNGGGTISSWDLEFSTTSPTLASGVTSQSSLTSNPSTISIGDASVRRGVVYYRVRTRNQVGTSPWSDINNFTLIDPPDAPPGISGFARTHDTVSGEITHPSYIGESSGLEYDVKVSVNSNLSSPVATDNSKVFSVSGLTRVTDYWIGVRIKNGAGWGNYYKQQFQTYATVPTKPFGYVVTDIASETAYVSKPTISDLGGAPIVKRRYQITTNTATPGTIYTAEGFYQTFLSELTPGTSYFVRMGVSNEYPPDNWSEWGDWVPFTTRNDVPTSPVLSLGGLTASIAHLTWTAPLNNLGATIFGYQGKVAKDLDFGVDTVIFNTLGDEFNTSITGLTTGETYYAQLWTITSNGTGSYSNIVSWVQGGPPDNAMKVWLFADGEWHEGKFWWNSADGWGL